MKSAAKLKTRKGGIRNKKIVVNFCLCVFVCLLVRSCLFMGKCLKHSLVPVSLSLEAL